MRITFSQKALHNYQGLPKTLQKTADKQFSLLLRNISYPSLRAKKYDEARDIWQARVTGKYRFYFQIRGDVYYILSIIMHPK